LKIVRSRKKTTTQRKKKDGKMEPGKTKVPKIRNGETRKKRDDHETDVKMQKPQKIRPEVSEKSNNSERKGCKGVN